MVSQYPNVAAPRDGLIGGLGDAVRIRQTARSQTGQDLCEPIRLEADQVEIETGKLERPEFIV